MPWCVAGVNWVAYPPLQRRQQRLCRGRRPAPDALNGKGVTVGLQYGQIRVLHETSGPQKRRADWSPGARLHGQGGEGRKLCHAASAAAVASDGSARHTLPPSTACHLWCTAQPVQAAVGRHGGGSEWGHKIGEALRVGWGITELI